MSDARKAGTGWGALLGTVAGKLFRRLRGEPGRNRRYFRGVYSGASAFLSALASTLRVLFLQVSGLIFLLFTITIVSAFFREYHKYELHQASLERVVMVGVAGAMFLYFAVSSFWRARRRSTRTS
jgi:ABC-type Fe3+-siderophore transport system permease subunit